MSWPRTGAWVDTVRLASGLILFLFALTHFLNHALGIWSLDAMLAAQSWRLAVTRSAVGTLMLASALVAHLALALWRLARLRTWRLPRPTLWLIATGAPISVLLMPHLFEAGIGPRLAGGALRYVGALHLIWPGSIVLQTSLLLFVWTHGCIGLHQWLKTEPWWGRASHALIALAALIPAAALAGVVTAGREAAREARPFHLPYSEAARLDLGEQALHAEVTSAG